MFWFVCTRVIGFMDLGVRVLVSMVLVYALRVWDVGV